MLLIEFAGGGGGGDVHHHQSVQVRNLIVFAYSCINM